MRILVTAEGINIFSREEQLEKTELLIKVNENGHSKYIS